ncbi:MAG: histidine phosphatase family protein [Nanoarchaeota archaeon]|nr:histidine phosphatase family protein [Nanoarchaeota archaeon]MBU1320912.1 histidine phosphatase family protein [Nanoarchaeota archaeon]MBU1597563.1 histidine phosphatase family protein [Nanoarchaeota archaeon]MBU2441934.1 histidine phosphatase family protein [Nanoarchaeota archaeon]
MKLILTRHGETEENIKKIWQGHLPGKLSKLGIEQAEKVALRLKDEKFDAIYSSDLARSSDTAKIIAKYHKYIPIYFVKELREVDLGSYTGKHNSEIDLDNCPPDMETRKSMCKRAKIILDRAYEEYPYGVVLFVGHNAINRALLTVIFDKPTEYVKECDIQHNTGVSIFEITEDKNHKVHLLNCAKHLE